MNKIVIGFIFIPFLFCCNSDEIQEPVLEFPEFVNGTLSYQNNQRKYILHIPESYDGKTPVPMVVFLHGGGGNAQTAQGFSNFNQVSDENGFLMLYPQAFFETADNSYAWADGRGLAPDKLGIDDVGYVDALVTALKAEYKIDTQKIYVCGFSNGSFLTQRIAFQKNNQYAAIGTLGGTMNESLYNSGNPERAIPMVFVFGTADPLVPYDGGYVSGNTELEPVKSIDDAVAYWKENNNCLNTLQKVNLPNTNTSDNSTIEVYQYTDCTCRADVKFYKVINAGHTWPGVLLPYAHSFGGTNLDMQASVELWNFFKRYSLCDE
jgi:polyhydroxybutyrate depolymerase